MLKPIVLKNGLNLFRFPKNGSRICLLGFIVPSGSNIEEGYFPQGISHLIERLFWCGTDKHPSNKALNLALESIGGNFTSITTQEMTGYFLTVPDYHQFKAVSMLAEVIQHSYFDTRDIDNEKRSLMELVKNQMENMEREPTYLTLSNLYTNSSLGIPVVGSLDTLTAITQEHILEYLSHQYVPQKSYLVVAGNFDNKALLELIDQEWGVWTPKTKKFIEPLEIHNEDIGELPRIIYRQKGISQTFLVISFLLENGLKPKILRENKKQENPLELDLNKITFDFLTRQATEMLLNTLLGQGLSSRLWSKTVDEEMLFLKIQSDLVKFSQTGFLQIFGQIENTQFSFGLESVLSVLEAFKKTTVSINELSKAKEYLQSRLIMEQEDLFNSVFWKMENYLGSGLNFEVDDLLAIVDKTEASQIRALAMDLFKPENLAITTLGTAKETRLVDKLIKKYLG